MTKVAVGALLVALVTAACGDGGPQPLPVEERAANIVSQGQAYDAVGLADEPDLIRACLAIDPSIARDGEWIWQAAKMNRLASARVLLEHGADPSAGRPGSTPIDVARVNGHDAMVELLESHREKNSRSTVDSADEPR